MASKPAAIQVFSLHLFYCTHSLFPITTINVHIWVISDQLCMFS